MKKKPSKSSKPNKNPLLEMLPANEIEYQKLVIANSERCIGPHGTTMDKFFQNQAERQRKKLEEMLKKQ